MYEPCVSKEPVKENCPGKDSSDSEEDTSKIGNDLWCFCGKYLPVTRKLLPSEDCPPPQPSSPPPPQQIPPYDRRGVSIVSAIAILTTVLILI